MPDAFCPQMPSLHSHCSAAQSSKSVAGEERIRSPGPSLSPSFSPPPQQPAFQPRWPGPKRLSLRTSSPALTQKRCQAPGGPMAPLSPCPAWSRGSNQAGEQIIRTHLCTVSFCGGRGGSFSIRSKPNTCNHLRIKNVSQLSYILC